MFAPSQIAKAKRVLKACEKAGILLTTAESCTGGLIAALLTEIPGSSNVFERGFVTYANAAKQELLGVSAALLARHGAVSAEVAEAMARGALKQSKAKLSVAVTGIAGPGGGTAQKPVGLVYVAVATHGNVQAHRCLFTGSRQTIRMRAVAKALELLVQQLRHND